MVVACPRVPRLLQEETTVAQKMLLLTGGLLERVRDERRMLLTQSHCTALLY